MELGLHLIWPTLLQAIDHQYKIHLGALVISDTAELLPKPQSRQPEHDSFYPKGDVYIQPEYIRVT